MSLRLRLALFGGVVVMVSLLTFGLLIYWLGAATQESDQDKALLARATETADALRAAPLLLPPTNSAAVLAGATDVSAHSDAFVEVVGSSRTVLSTTGRVGTAIPVAPDAGLDALAANGGGAQTITAADGIQMRVQVQPWTSGGVAGGYVIAAQPTSIQSTNLRGLRAFLIIASIPMILVGLIASWVVSGRAVRPLKEVAATAEAIRTTHDLQRRLPEGKRHDELGVLSRSFNGMLDELQSVHQQMATALEMQRRFIADASHELRTPLTTIRGNAGLLARGPKVSEEDRTAAISDIARESDRMSRITESLLTLARADSGQALELATVSLKPLVEDVCRQAGKRDDKHTIEILEVADVAIQGNDDSLRELLWILLDNAEKHTPSGRRIQVGLVEADDHVRLVVVDDGPGVPPADAERIFERFYQVDPSRSGRGSGLGLSIARWIATQHHGTISARNNDIRGCTFTVRFPFLTRL